MDYLKDLSKQFGGKIKSQESLNMNFKEKSFRKLIIKSYKGFKIKIEEYGNLYLLGIKVNSELALSINNPDKIFLFNKPIDLGTIPYKVYVSDSDCNPLKNEYLIAFWKGFSGKITSLKLSIDESVFFYNNYISIVLNSNRNLMSILDDIIDLINSHPGVFKKGDDNISIVKDIPDSLKPLLPLLKKWSLSDDIEREELMEKTGERQKKNLISSVDPLMKEINDFLDSFKDKSLSAEAILIGNLAELVSELKLGK